MHRHVQLVAVRIFEVQEFGGNTTGVNRDQAQIAANAILGVHDRRAGLQVIELPDNRLGIPIRRPASTACLRAFTE